MTDYYYDHPAEPYLGRLDRDIADSSTMTQEAKDSHATAGCSWSPEDTGQELCVRFPGYTLTTAEETELNSLVLGLISKPTGQGYWFKRKVVQEQSQTSTWTNYLTMTRTDIPYGDYKITWSADIDSDSANTMCEGRVAIDGTPGSKAQTNINTMPLAGFDVRTLDDGPHTIEIDFRRSVGNGTAYIRNSKIIIEPIGQLEEAT